MNKIEAIKWYKEITGGAGVDRGEVLGVIQRGNISERYWNDGLFSLGVEYGVMIGLVKAFNITREDLL